MKKVFLLVASFLFIFSSAVSFSVPEAKAYSGYYVNPYKTYTYKAMQNDLSHLRRAYPGLVKVSVIGRTHYGRNIYAVSLGYGKATVFINGAHHAREWLTTNLNMNMIDKYAWAYKHHRRIGNYDAQYVLNRTTIWFVPMVNPDGVTLQQYGYKAFPRKDWKKLIRMNGGSRNFKWWKANAQGVDLNRQYDAGWRKPTHPKYPSSQNFNGDKPETAPEVGAVLNLVHKVNPEMEISYHTMGRIIYWNYKQPRNLLNRNHVYAAHLAAMTHYRLVSPYGSGGMGFSDWFMYRLHKPGFTIEIGMGYNGSLPVGQFTRIWNENKSAGMYLADQGYKLYESSLSAPLKKNQIKVNNSQGTNDTVTVNHLKKNDMIRIYSSKGKILAAKSSKGSSLIVHLNLGSSSGKIYLTINDPKKRMSIKTSVSFSGEPSTALKTNQIAVTNNRNSNDLIKITGLKRGDVIRVYNSQNILLKTQMSTGYSTALSIKQIGEEPGRVYLTVTHSKMLTSKRTIVLFKGEAVAVSNGKASRK